MSTTPQPAPGDIVRHELDRNKEPLLGKVLRVESVAYPSGIVTVSCVVRWQDDHSCYFCSPAELVVLSRAAEARS